MKKIVTKSVAEKKANAASSRPAAVKKANKLAVAISFGDADEDVRWQAQELAFDAMEAPTAVQAVKLSRQALALDPDCVDALVVLNDFTAKTAAQRIAGLEQAVEAGERSLGRRFFAENKGHFWSLIETRPYMRAREELAQRLRSSEDYTKAIGHCEAMLKLNPNDNQGMRQPLLGMYLAVDDLKGAQALLARYPEDWLSTFAWGRVLERLLSGDIPGATTALATARKQNPYFERFLTGKAPMPKGLPELYAPGSKEEAVICLDHLGLAWAEFPMATIWLVGQLMGQATTKKTANPRRAARRSPKLGVEGSSE